MPNYSRSGRRIDRRLIAAYLEGLLDAVSARRVKALLESDEGWAAEHARQSRVRDLLASSPAPDAEAAGERVWRRVLASTADPTAVPLWSRRLTVPMPLAMGAAALVLVLAFGLVYTIAQRSMAMMSITTVPSGLKQVQIQAPIADLQQILRSVESSLAREVIIRLPDSPEQFFVGEPVLLRAADVDRGRYR